MKYKRPQFKILKNRIEEPRKFIQVIAGPRQVGKTTMVNQLLSETKIPNLYISADGTPNSNSFWIEQQWEIARIKLKSSYSDKLVLVIDEIQKIHNWSEIVKAQWDKDSIDNINILLILLGSSKLLLQKGLTESLSGRFEIIQMNHWSYVEMENAFGLNEEQFVWFGGFPGTIDIINDENRWKNYIRNSLIDTTISKDILMLSRVDKPALLRNLFELGCSHSGEIISLTKILGQLQDSGNTTTLTHYLSLLSSAGILCGLEKFSRNLFRQRLSIPKFQVFNSAFLSAISKYSFNEIIQIPEKWGRNIESAIGAHLVNNSIQNDFKVFYWRDRNDEVDFIIEKKGDVIGIEVKSGKIKFANGLEAFKKQFNPKKILLISNDGLTWKEFLKLNPIDLF